MSIAEKLTTIAENEPKVFEAGKKSQYDEFWDNYQQNGATINHQLMYSNIGWSDETFNPKYPLKGTSYWRCFYTATRITRIPVTIDGRNASTNTSTGFAQLCYGMSNLKSIYKIIPRQESVWVNAFSGCSKLESVIFDSENGKIGRDIDFSHCTRLNVESMKSIINALADYSTENKDVYTVTFYSKCWTALEEDSTPKDEGIDFEGTWKAYVQSKGWLT